MTFGDNIGRLIIRLKEREHRPLGADGVIQQLRRDVSHLQGLRMFLSNPPAIRIGGTLSTSDYVFTLTGTDLKQLYGPGQALEARLQNIAATTGRGDQFGAAQSRDPAQHHA